jgi:hypothetical protein
MALALRFLVEYGSMIARVSCGELLFCFLECYTRALWYVCTADTGPLLRSELLITNKPFRTTNLELLAVVVTRSRVDNTLEYL